jgi:hypothetical protein
MPIPPELEAAMEPIEGVLRTFADLEPAREPGGDDAHEHVVVHADEAIILHIREPESGRTVRGVFTLADVPADPLGV